MSIATKRRFVTKQLESEMVLPEEDEKIAQILNARGNNLHEVVDENDEKYLVSMPTKFRKSVWVKRGQFVLVRPIEEGDKVRAEISKVLDDENVLYIRDLKLWPHRFEADAERMTRASKREMTLGSDKKHEVIDADMLPPSESDEEGSEVDCGGEGDDTGSEADDEDEQSDEMIIETYNPNRAATPNYN